MAVSRRSRRREFDIWPGFVDALASLLMVIIFLLLVFVLAQFYLGQALSGRDKALDQLNHQLADLADQLSMEKANSAALKAQLASLTGELQASLAAKDKLSANLDQTVRSKDALSAQLTQAETDTQTLSVTKAELDAANKALAADKETMAASAVQLASLQQQVAMLESVRDSLQSRLLASQKQAGDAQGASKQAQAEVALLNQQVMALRQQMAALAKALDASEAESKAQKVQIVDLGKRLNAALAAKVQELQQYRSEFFGKLHQILGNRPGIQVIGDRFVFQSEVLFPTGSAEINDSGKAQLAELAHTLMAIAAEIPATLPWMLRVDGHTDSRPIHTAQFPSNWELSTARAIAVVKFLISQGVPPERLAATGFADYQPLVPGNTESAWRLDRRIELRLTER